MKVYVKCPSTLSRAMFRVANALERWAPDDLVLVEREDDADLLVLHVIGLEALGYRTDQPCAVIQYCTGGGQDLSAWRPLWERARVVWSYYNLFPHLPTGARYVQHFYHAPLGIDTVFRTDFTPRPRDITVLTSGYVNGHGQEAIEEPTLSAQRVNATSAHLGPIPTGLSPNVKVNSKYDLGDSQLASLYRRVKYVAGLRFVEGFELGVVEGLACGARPVVFDRSDNRHWFGDHALYVPECDGEELVARLAQILAEEPRPVSREERRLVLDQFNWRTLVTEFWARVKERV